jgi:hypothetical protein
VDLFNIFDKDDPSKGVQLFNVSYGNFGKKFKEEIDADPDNIYCVLPTKEGKTLIARFTEEKFGTGTYYECSKLDFKDRKEDISDKILDQAIDLDLLLDIKSFDEIQKLFLGLDGTEEVEKEEGEDEEEKEMERASKRSSKKDDDDDEDDKKEVRKPSRKEKDEEDEDEKEEKKEPLRRGKTPEKETKGGKCPHGHTFGASCNKEDECDDCPKWDACMEEKDNLKKAK